MMGFWDLSDNSSATTTGTDYEVPGGNLDPIPAGSSVLALIDEAKWDRAKNSYDTDTATGPEYVSLRWTILAPKAYENRKVYHKLWVTDDDPSVKDAQKAIAKRDKARKMLAAIDANAGGKLTAQDGKPSNDSLALHLSNKPMVITLMEWAIGDASGNWVAAVAPKTKALEIKPPKAKTASARGNDGFGSASSGASSGQTSMMDDDSIPF